MMLAGAVIGLEHPIHAFLTQETLPEHTGCCDVATYLPNPLPRRFTSTSNRFEILV